MTSDDDLQHAPHGIQSLAVRQVQAEQSGVKGFDRWAGKRFFALRYLYEPGTVVLIAEHLMGEAGIARLATGQDYMLCHQRHPFADSGRGYITNIAELGKPTM